MSLIKEFKEFAMRGNVVDLAVGVIIGAAFGKIVTSLVQDMIMPPISKLTGGANFADQYAVLDHEKWSKVATNGMASLAQLKAAGVPVIAYGQFLQNVFDFVLVAACIFLMVKGINELRRRFEKQQAPAAAPAPTPTESLLAEIRDLLKAGK
jgi:large conductance mechanosensitive channel